MQPITLEDIRNALFDIGNERAPKIYGYAVKFFKAIWEIVGIDLQRTILEFFSSSHMLKQRNYALIVLVPKLLTPRKSQTIDRYLAARLRTK